MNKTSEKTRAETKPNTIKGHPHLGNGRDDTIKTESDGGHQGHNSKASINKSIRKKPTYPSHIKPVQGRVPGCGIEKIKSKIGQRFSIKQILDIYESTMEFEPPPSDINQTPFKALKDDMLSHIRKYVFGIGGIMRKKVPESSYKYILSSLNDYLSKLLDKALKNARQTAGDEEKKLKVGDIKIQDIVEAIHSNPR
eukprot:CAMPEP_0115014022 /NCGR_PEP_ID=MMETSP0216-20121206/25791_1 /TAXON_ID=223996 /ORGANISM="Protocruzia adherens, Strain Boccale" /LENGTH=195 /DNA_ID=CAMNT_0002383603 /DNA_START=247 /DNA_END=832 /DNA_ORIENTATION=+